MASKRENVLAGLRDKAAVLPAGAGVYLFKDSAGRVLYVGKAKSLRARVSSYFQPASDLASSRGPDIARMIGERVVAMDVLLCDSEVDALLRENRLIKDIQPPFNERLKDGKSYPYLQIRTGEVFPRVEITRKPLSKGAKLYGPFVAVADLRAALPLLQRVFRFRTCKLDITDPAGLAVASGDDKCPHGTPLAGRLSFRPCILHTIKQCSASCAGRISKADYRRDIANLRRFMESKGAVVSRRLKKEMVQASDSLNFERAAALRDQLRALEGLRKRGLVAEHPQPEVFYVDPADGLANLAELLSRDSPLRTIEGIDIAHLGGGETAGSLVCFIDGRPFKGGYRRYKIRTAQAGDDYAAITEVVSRRYKRAGRDEELFPDVILIDGGKGQLSAAKEALEQLTVAPPALLSLAKREELVYIQGRSGQTPARLGGAVRLKRNDPALRLLQSVRDEAHRFAQAYHHVLRRRKTLGKTQPVRSRRKRS